MTFFKFIFMNKKNIIIFSVIFLIILVGGYFFFFKKKQPVFDYNNEALVFTVNRQGDFDPDRLNRLEEKRLQALDLYRKEINDNWTWITIGNYYEYARDYDKAILAYKRVLELNSNDTMALSNLAHIYDRQFFNYEEARNYYDQLITAVPYVYENYIDLANMYEYSMQKPTKAAETYLTGLQNIPGHTNLMIGLIRYYVRQNDLTEAKKYAAILFEQDPNNETYKRDFGKLLE